MKAMNKNKQHYTTCQLWHELSKRIMQAATQPGAHIENCPTCAVPVLKSVVINGLKYTQFYHFCCDTYRGEGGTYWGKDNEEIEAMAREIVTGQASLFNMIGEVQV